MKRSSSRDTPPRRSKRSRSSVGRYDDSSDERLTPERIRRRTSRGRSPPSPRRYSDHRDEYGRSRDIVSSASYKVLCVSALHPKASDELIKDTLYREYKRFGDITIRISHDLDQERVAYVCFRSSEDARDAKHSKPRIVIYDKVAIVEPVFESRPRYYRPRSPVLAAPEQYPVERYERPPYGPPGPPPHEFRRDVPPPPHHDFIRVPIHRDPYGPPHPRHPHVPPHLAPGHPHHPHYAPPPRGFPHPPESFQFENKKDKFPNYLHHIPPEDDPLATRTLFAGNLEINISEEELRRIFERYGIVEDIDIKRPPPGTGNAFAFVRFQNLDMAHRSKVELSGQYIGKFQCKIGYGKATPTTRIWVGGLGQWTSIPQLEREFDRFGAIKKIDYIKGDSSAYIQYDSIDAAQAAVKEMRGFPLGGMEHRLRVDFADVPDSTEAFRAHAPGTAQDDYLYDAPVYDHWAADSADYPYGPSLRGYRGRGRGYPFHDRRGAYRGTGYPGEHYPPEGEWVGRRPDIDYEKHRRSVSREPGGDRNSRSHSPRLRSIDSDSGSDSRRNGHLGSARSLADIARRSAAVWQGALILKNSLFPAKFHLTDGDGSIIDSLMRDEDGKPLLRITQRLRLDQPKLDDVSKRISSSSSHAIFLGLSGSSSNITIDDATVQTRPLRNLVSYLKQKEAAGVISLPNKESDSSAVLYAFPACSFSTELLKRSSPGLSEEGLKEDHLVIVVVRGGTT
ncbi:UNVERIFIED_CONTAM: hypothetical protein PYX00_001138 [Menopon gallinae]|uniref:RNA-binding protein spenito n=1 Tax=Menopon gallinae TaxID=328185 RepID=A0AAW2ICX6_9NEOP